MGKSQTTFIRDIKFDKHIGAKVVTFKKDCCKVKLDVKKQHLNYGGLVHGGVIATLCDIALSGAVAKAMKKYQWCVTIHLSVEYMNHAVLGDRLYAYGKIAKVGRTLAFVDGFIEKRDKTKVAKAHGIWFIKQGPSKKIRIKKSVKQIE